jgi:hypothetical protein
MSDRTTIRFERNPMMGAAHLRSDDGGRAWVFCSIPGGRPWFSLNIRGDHGTPVTNAPQCDTHRAFEAFVRERFQ